MNTIVEQMKNLDKYYVDETPKPNGGSFIYPLMILSSLCLLLI